MAKSHFCLYTLIKQHDIDDLLECTNKTNLLPRSRGVGLKENWVLKSNRLWSHSKCDQRHAPACKK